MDADLDTVAGLRRTALLVQHRKDVFHLHALAVLAEHAGAVGAGGEHGIDAVELQRLIESIQAEIDYSLADIAPYDEEMTETLARESSVDLEELSMLGEEEDHAAEPDAREKKERLGVEHQTMRFKVSFDTAESVTEVIKTIIREQGIKTGSEMEDAGEALVWLTQYYKDVTDEKVV